MENATTVCFVNEVACGPSTACGSVCFVSDQVGNYLLKSHCILRQIPSEISLILLGAPMYLYFSCRNKCETVFMEFYIRCPLTTYFIAFFFKHFLFVWHDVFGFSYNFKFQFPWKVTFILPKK